MKIIKRYFSITLATLCMLQGHALLANETPVQHTTPFEQVTLGIPRETDAMLLIDGYCYPVYRIAGTDYVSAETVAHLGCEIHTDTTQTSIKNPYALERPRYIPATLDYVLFDKRPVTIGSFKTYQLKSARTTYIPIGALATYYTFREGDNTYFLNRTTHDLNQYVACEGDVLTNITDDLLSIEVTGYTWNGNSIEETVQIIEDILPGEQYVLENVVSDDQHINYATLVSAVTLHNEQETVTQTLEIKKNTLQQGAPMLFQVYEEEVAKVVAEEAAAQEAEKEALLQQAYKEEQAQSSFPETFVYGTMLRDVGGIKKGERVHVWNAEGGYYYYVWHDGVKVRVPWNSVRTDNNPLVQKNPATKEAIEAFANDAGWVSQSRYLVWTDLYRQRTYVFAKQEGTWVLIREMLSTTGNNKTPTPIGQYTLQAKVPYFGVEKGYRCKNAIQIFGDYLYHSVKFNAGGDYVLGGQVLGERGSYGCIRLSPEDSEWFYTTMTLGTKVVIR